MTARLRCIRRIGGDERGVSVVELALFMPVLLVMLTGVVELSMFLAEKMRVEQAAYRAIELAQVAPTQISDADLKAQAASAAGVDESNVDVTRELRCASAVRTDYDAGCASGETVERYLTIDVRAQYQPHFPAQVASFFSDLDAQGAVPLAGTATLRVQ